jgi:hypothetical protein
MMSFDDRPQSPVEPVQNLLVGFALLSHGHSSHWRSACMGPHKYSPNIEPIRDRRTLLKGLTYVPGVIITDKLKRYGAAKREILPGMEHRQHRSLNNRAKHSHQPARQRERRLQRFKSPGHAQCFPSAYGPIASHVRPRRHLLPAPEYRQEMTQRFQLWREMTGTAMAA